MTGINSYEKGCCITSNGGQIYGFDILKIFMATMIVAIHTKAFYDVDIIRRLTQPFLDSAVPVFFILSSFFLFRKMDSKGYSWPIYGSFLKRIIILYAFWFIVTLPLTLYGKWYYFDYNFPKVCWYVLRDFFFSYTFSGSWFLTALMVGTFLVFLLKKYLKAPGSILTIIALLFFTYVKMVSYCPEWMQKPYLFIQTNIRDVVELTPITGFIWCLVGCVFAEGDLLKRITIRLRESGIVIVFMVMYLLTVFLPSLWAFAALPFLVLSIILLAYTLPFRPSDVYLKLRNISILIYLIHFPLLNISVLLPANCPHIVYYVIVLIGALLIALIILKLETIKIFNFLKYSH